uniref:Uncharacterized protein n=1 Tax=Megaselia scalaris TaxID=36166 RepID=T1GPD2_MEGSC
MYMMCLVIGCSRLYIAPAMISIRVCRETFSCRDILFRYLHTSSPLQTSSSKFSNNTWKLIQLVQFMVLFYTHPPHQGWALSVIQTNHGLDDGLLAADDKDEDVFIKELKSEFKIVSKDADYFLGISVLNK